MQYLNGSKNGLDDHFFVRVLRQDRPDLSSYWQTFSLERVPGLNVTSVLQHIAAHPLTASGKQVAPVAYDANCLEEVCGACTMLINGRVRQACTALVERLLEQQPRQIELRPMSKFPLIRDLMVDRRRLFRALEKLQGWIPVDGYHDAGPGPRQSQEAQQQAYPLSKCMSCGCCLEACPQYTKVLLDQQPDETSDQFHQRQDAAFDAKFIGAHANNQVVLTNSHPTGRMTAGQRLDALMAPGGIQNCGKAANCEAVCPQKIPLMTSWGRAGRATTLYVIKRFFDG
ncbi:MAG TPA: succinate dehydrogenase iron-sulfur subunit [Pirellulales bacterium]|jgi:succinate dehydrogenase / fumarate reductase iron-sulfur subunit|nr:succinate dehydrogenase iron-sulfur subunit [Pirellulales bacterium]